MFIDGLCITSPFTRIRRVGPPVFNAQFGVNVSSAFTADRASQRQFRSDVGKRAIRLFSKSSLPYARRVKRTLG
jgi:hypothetical protein